MFAADAYLYSQFDTTQKDGIVYLVNGSQFTGKHFELIKFVYFLFSFCLFVLHVFGTPYDCFYTYDHLVQTISTAQF